MISITHLSTEQSLHFDLSNATNRVNTDLLLNASKANLIRFLTHLNSFRWKLFKLTIHVRLNLLIISITHSPLSKVAFRPVEHHGQGKHRAALNAPRANLIASRLTSTHFNGNRSS
ncbi:hypothetical protein CEXT_277771 [Caerostris extrusa]|uniref:Uncharacterized protein n=1 Tax=Caerostris extrusa TaxID=172846 RepID=A0AAV4NG31_CAEEX|nr:hypothetical protein CEXT_277771 [Caerostris extrusa]